jgi:primary-amine oxidase
MNLKHYIFAAILMAALSTTVTARPGGQNCPSGQTINNTFSSGAGWDICWEIDPKQGVVFSNIYYNTPAGISRRVLGEASVSQIVTEFDDGSSSQFIVTQSGLGGDNLVNLTSSDCPDGQRIQLNGKNVLCRSTKARGYVHKDDVRQFQGELLDLFSISRIGDQTFILRWKFYDSGIIEPVLGLSGKLNKYGSNTSYGWSVGQSNQVAISSTNHYFWRLDFDLGETPNDDVVEEISSIPSSDRLKKSIQIQTLGVETNRSLDIETKRFWRVRDGAIQNSNIGFISYELVLINYAHQGSGNSNASWLSSDFFVTKYNACERFAVNNPTQNGCAANVAQFVNGENIDEKDLVTWYRASYHHLPRDEDLNPIPVRWTGFQLLPRDWVSENPL